MECEDLNPGFGLNLDNPYSPFDTTYKFLNPGTPKSEADPLDTGYKTPITSVSMLSQQSFLAAEQQHPWSDMVYDEACIPLRQMSPRVSPSSSISSNLSSLSHTPPRQTPTSESSASNPFRSRMSSVASDQLIFNSEATHAHTHEYNAVFDKLIPSQQSYHSDLELPSLAPDSPSPDSLVPTDTLRTSNITMSQVRQADTRRAVPSQDNADYGDQYMSDEHDSEMDVDSNDSNDEGNDGETSSSKDSSSSRESSSMIEGSPARSTRTRASARASAKSTKSIKPASQKSSTKTKKNTAAKSTASSRRPQAVPTKGSSSRASIASTASTGSTSSVSSKESSQARKHSSEEESPEAKRQKFLERNRMAASKCREKKRLQTLKTIADADAITARNQALHESLDELQEEVRTLKNQILCHRDCGCDVIQKFVQSSFCSTPFFTGTTAAAAAGINQGHPSHASTQLC
ncbi:hypothetical protein BGZ54_001450 [Gamsiella multidivaricata]|nr:hypothetical protein BGZ54_001450 [Gamsiella multidivaricata]